MPADAPTARPLLAALMAAALAVATLVVAPIATADEHIGEDAAPDAVEVERFFGNDRAFTAADVATEVFDEAETAIVARFDREFDALAAAYLAGCLEAPILLTWTSPQTIQGETYDVHPATADALEELGVENVVLLGGTAALSQAVEDALAEDYEVERVFGDGREDTAQAIAEYEDCEPGGTVLDGDFPLVPPTTAILARSDLSVDALAGGGLAFDLELPILLTPSQALAPQAEEALENLDVDRVLLLGGEAAISAAVADELEEQGYEVVRLDGDGRWETAITIAEFAIEFADWSEAEVGLARSDLAFDAMTSAPYTGTHQAPLLLVTTLDGGDLHPATGEYLEDNADDLIRLTIFGGSDAVSVAVADAAEEAATATEDDEDDEDEDDEDGGNGLPF